ncbi:AAA family ATPase [Psychroserpens sp. BH13MA-6]
MEEALKQFKNGNSEIIKVVLFGPESTGKSSLAKALAHHFDTSYVKEFSRIYAEKKANQNQELTKVDVMPIAIGQMQLENEQVKKVNELLICDTDLLETQVYSQYYYDGYCPKLVEKYAKTNSYDLYFLTYIDTVWEADGIRDSPHNRLELFKRFEQALIATGKPYVLVKGNFEQRLETCILHVAKLLKQNH